MLKPSSKRGLMLDFINPTLETTPNLKRVFEVNKNPVKVGDVVYFMTREYRLEDNWGFLFAKNLAKSLDKDFRVAIHCDKIFYSKIQENLFLAGIEKVGASLKAQKIKFEIKKDFKPIFGAGAVVMDFNPIKPSFKTGYKIFEVDSHNIVPARFASDKQEYSAGTFRRKIYQNIYEFLSKYPQEGARSAPLKDFIENRLPLYAQFQNDPNHNALSHLSGLLHFGFISSQRVALEVVKSTASRENKESFLEELIVRKELADNFCLYNKNYKSLKSAPAWGLQTLGEHRADFRNYIYSKEEFEFAKTHDNYWNYIQKDLLKDNRIHSYLRMYWAKKILEWSPTPEDALDKAIYLNDKYSIDGNDPSGYVGILWSIAGLHDRAFASRPVFGKIRYMNKKVKDYDKT